MTKIDNFLLRKKFRDTSPEKSSIFPEFFASQKILSKKAMLFLRLKASSKPLVKICFANFYSRSKIGVTKKSTIFSINFAVQNLCKISEGNFNGA